MRLTEEQRAELEARLAELQQARARIVARANQEIATVIGRERELSRLLRLDEEERDLRP